MRSILAPLLLAVPLGTGDELVHAHAEGVRLRHTFSVEYESRLEESHWLIDEEEQEALGYSEEDSFTLQLVFVDEALQVEDGGLRRLRREFETVGARVEGSWSFEGDEDLDAAGDEYESELVSDLEGRAVEFAVGEDGEVEVTAAERSEDAELDEELLAGLRLDYSFAGLLPDAEVSEGDAWEVDVEENGPLLLASFLDAGLRAEDEEWSPEPDAQESWDGEIRVRHAGRRKVDERSLVVLELAFEIDYEIEYDEEAIAALYAEAEDDDEEELVPPSALREENHHVGEGLLLWDPRARRMHSLEYTVESRERHVTETEYDDPDLDYSSETDVEVYAAVARVSLAVEPLEDD